MEYLNSIGIDYPELLYSNAISSNTTVSDQKYGASSEKMAAAYAVFANGGTYYKPQYVNKVVFTDNTTKEFAPEGKQVLSPEIAYMMTDMMKSVLTYGVGANAAVSGVPIAGKTGTSNYADNELAAVLASNSAASSSSMAAPDHNFVGYSTKYAMAVWTGYSNRNTPILDNGNLVATDVFRSMMTYLNPVETALDWEMPSGLYRYGSYLYLNGAQRRNTYANTTTSQTPAPTVPESTEGDEGVTEEEVTEEIEEPTTAENSPASPSND